MNIKKVIKEKGWTMEQLSVAMNITQPSVSSIINGNPTLAKLKAMADAMGITVSELLADEEDDTITCPYCGRRIKFSKDDG